MAVIFKRGLFQAAVFQLADSMGDVVAINLRKGGVGKITATLFGLEFVPFLMSLRLVLAKADATVWMLEIPDTPLFVKPGFFYRIQPDVGDVSVGVGASF